MKSLLLRPTLSTYVKKACPGIAALRRILNLLSRFAHLYPYTIHLYNRTLITVPPLWDICGKQLKDKVQKIQNRVGRVITGASYDISLVDVLDNLKWKNLETRRSQIETTPTYKILSQWLICPPFESLSSRLNDTNINCNLNLIQHFQGQRLISSNVVLSIVVQQSGIIFLMRQRQPNHFPNFKASLPSAGSLWFINLYFSIF